MDKRCFHCMKPMDGAEVCPYCGKSNSDPSLIHETLLMPGTVIANRYLVGAALDRNGEGVSYLAYDELVQRRVRLREFFPGNLAHREGNGKTITVNTGLEIQYKALMTDFVELSRGLIALSGEKTCMLRALDIFTDNATIYTVYEDVSCITLASFFNEMPANLKWEKAEELFKPLFDTVATLNANGIIHRGISPDTILVTRDGSLRLKGICTPAVRAINSEVKPELFSGYAAPEQYEKCTGHGEWTDVYALSAVLYRALTGRAVLRADLRTGDSVKVADASALNPTVPKAVAAALAQGLEPNCARRIRKVRDLFAAMHRTGAILIDEEEEEEAPPIRRKPAAPPAKFDLKKALKKVPVWLIVLLVSLPLMLLLFIFTWNLILGGGNKPESSVIGEESSMISSEEESFFDESSREEESFPQSSELVSEEESSNVPLITVGDYTGQFYQDVVNDTTYSPYLVFEKIEIFDDSTDIGVVIDQDIDSKEEVPEGTTIRLTVSKGIRYIDLPPFADESGAPISAESYKEYLESVGLTVYVRTVSNPDYESGTIIELDHPLDQQVDRAAVHSITIFVAE